MITQLMRIRNVFLPNDHPRAFGYIVGKAKYRGLDRLTIAWTVGEPETLSAHPNNIAMTDPLVFFTNQPKPH